MKRTVLILCLTAAPAFGQIGTPSPLPSQLQGNLRTMTASPTPATDPTTQLLKRNLYPNRAWANEAGQPEPRVNYGGADSKRMATGTTVIQNGQVCTHISGGRLICR